MFFMKKLILISLCLLGSLAAQSGTLTLDLKCLIQGYYSANGQMVAAAENQNCECAGPEVTECILVQLCKSAFPYSVVAEREVKLKTNGQVTVNFSDSNLRSGSYYIVVKGSKNALETWSSNPEPFRLGQTTHYDFTDAASKAYGDNQFELTDPSSGEVYYCFFSGDVNQDGNIDLLDEAQMEADLLNFASGCISTDLNGDGNVDLLDWAIFELNSPSLFISVMSPPLSGQKGSSNGGVENPKLSLSSINEMVIFPNPSVDFINIYFNAQLSGGEVTFELTDVNNKLVMEFKSTCHGKCLESMTFPTTLDASLYFLKMYEGGKMTAVKKVLVNK